VKCTLTLLLFIDASGDISGIETSHPSEKRAAMSFEESEPDKSAKG